MAPCPFKLDDGLKANKFTAFDHRYVGPMLTTNINKKIIFYESKFSSTSIHPSGWWMKCPSNIKKKRKTEF